MMSLTPYIHPRIHDDQEGQDLQCLDAENKATAKTFLGTLCLGCVLMHKTQNQSYKKYRIETTTKFQIL